MCGVEIECRSIVPFLFYDVLGEIWSAYAIFIAKILMTNPLHNRNGMMNALINLTHYTLSSCIVLLLLYRIVLLLAFAIVGLFFGIAMVLRWHHVINNARMALLALDGLHGSLLAY